MNLYIRHYTCNGPPEAAATSIYCRMLDQFVDCLNVRYTEEAAIKRNIKAYEELHGNKAIYFFLR